MMDTIRVLHVDDEVDFAAAVGRRLARRGVLMHSVTSGPAALDTLAREPFDVVLLDIKMPGMDGIGTLGEIRRTHPDVEVIMLTAHAQSEIVISSLAMGAYDYLQKPADMDDLIAKIEDAAQRRKRSRSEAAEADRERLSYGNNSSKRG